MGPSRTEAAVARILNDAWMVRHNVRGGRVTQDSHMAEKRARAIRKLGLTVRESFNESDDFESLLAAIVDGLRPTHQQPF